MAYAVTVHYPKGFRGSDQISCHCLQMSAGERDIPLSFIPVATNVEDKPP